MPEMMSSNHDGAKRRPPPPPRRVVELSSEDLIEEPESSKVMKRPLPKPRYLETREAESPITIGSATEASIKHPDRNEDAYYKSAKRGVVAVFDGMGGMPAGDYASASAAEQLGTEKIDEALAAAKTPAEKKTAERIKNIFSSPRDAVLKQQDVEDATRDMLIRMNAEVEKLAENPAVRQKAVEYFKQELGSFDPANAQHQKLMEKVLKSVGCTASFMKTWRGEDGKDRVTMGQIGDSRVYRLRGNELKKLTRDDSHVEILMEEGLIANDQDVSQTIDKEKIVALADKRKELAPLVLKLIQSPEQKVTLGSFRNQVTQGIGVARFSKEEFGVDFTPQAKTEELEDGDVVFAVSDGVSDNLTDEKIRAIALKNKDNPQKLAEELQKESTAVTIKGKKSDARAKPDDATANVLLYRRKK